YTHSEQFCAKKPLTGTITYVVHSDKTATLQLRLQNLSVRNKLVGVEWQQTRTEGGSHGTYGYTIASFRSSADGRSQQSTLRFFRAPYAHGLGIVLDTGPHARTIGALARC
ncbi:MAG TPA: hypothetical protein VG708_09565, partial [Mycobacteriales bacterium]|nr:hypothetical protein [Mycobacteriales bacterium]